MNENEVNELIQRCKLLKHKFLGVFAENNFTKTLQLNTFIVFNASTSDNAGTHWLLLCIKNKNLIFADPLGQPILFYKDVYRRVVFTQGDVQLCRVLENQPIQSRGSQLYVCFFCILFVFIMLFCIYIAHLFFSICSPLLDVVIMV